VDPEPSQSAAERVKLDAAHVYEIETPFGLGPFAPYQYERMVHQTRVRVFWPRVAMWAAGLFFGLWLGGASALYFFVKYQRDFTEVRFSHMALLPWKLEEYRRAKGEFHLAQGLEAAEEQRWRDAFFLLRSGLPYVPEHEEARMLVARVYLMAGRPDHAGQVLVAGLDHHPNHTEYLRKVLAFLFGQQADEAVLGLADGLEARVGEGVEPAFARMVATARAYAHFNRNRYTAAEAAFARAGLGGTPEARFVAARITWERGRRDEGLRQLRSLQAQVPDDPEINRTVRYYLNEAGRRSELRRVGLALQLARPERADGYLDFIAGAAAEGDAEAVAEAEADYLRRFADEGRALLSLAELASAAGRVASVERVVARLRELGAAETPVATVLLAEALLEAGEVERLAVFPVGEESWNESVKLSLEGLRAVALLRLGREVEAEPLLWRVTESRRLAATTAVLLAGRWQKVGQTAAARRLLARAVEIDPLHQPALVALLRDAVASGELDDKLELATRLAGMRKPPEDLLVTLKSAYDSDRFLYVPERAVPVRVIGERLAELRAARG
jgi:tetratricopeptide (TPR) repeat protein